MAPAANEKVPFSMTGARVGRAFILKSWAAGPQSAILSKVIGGTREHRRARTHGGTDALNRETMVSAIVPSVASDLRVLTAPTTHTSVLAALDRAFVDTLTPETVPTTTYKQL